MGFNSGFKGLSAKFRCQIISGCEKSDFDCETLVWLLQTDLVQPES